MRIFNALLLIVLCITSAFFFAVPADAKAIHRPMAPPLSVQCSVFTGHDQYMCLRPGYKAVLLDLRGLSHTFSSPNGCSPKRSGGVIVVDPGTGKDSCGIKRI